MKKAKNSPKKTRARAKPARKAVKRAVKKATKKILGKVVHYYDRIGVAIVNLASPLKIGDTVKFRHGQRELFTQEVHSLQIEHEPVERAKKGQIVGVKVDGEAKSGTVVLPA